MSLRARPASDFASVCACMSVLTGAFGPAAFKYSQPGSGPLRAKGTESLVLGTQLLFVVGWALPPGPGERWECGDTFKGSKRWGLG